MPQTITQKRAELRGLRAKARHYPTRGDEMRMGQLRYEIEKHEAEVKKRKRVGAPSRKLPRISQAACKQVWRAAFNEPPPKRLRVRWSVKLGVYLGWAYGSGTVELSWQKFAPEAKTNGRRYGDRQHDEYSLLGVLIHEFVHLRCPGLKHGKEFKRIEHDAQRAIGLDIPSYMLVVHG